MIAIPAYKDKQCGTWYASFYYTDWQGHRKLKKKRGFATRREAKAFVLHIQKLPAKTGLSILFWTGLRISELLSLRADDIDLEARTLTVNKGFQVVDGKELIMDTKTPRSRRVIPLPEALCDEIKLYMDALYEPQPDDRLFPYTKSYFHRQMQKACDAAGMEKIRLHDLRYPNVKPATKEIFIYKKQKLQITE